MPLPLLPGFMIAGFECSTPITRDGYRIDELALTQHDRHVRADYRMLCEAGIRTVRDGVRWNLIDRRGHLDFSSVLPFLEAAEAEGMTVLWDLFHYGYPSDLNPFEEDFIVRFADYCYAFSRLVARRGSEIPFYTPVNEISYFAWAGSEGDKFAPRASARGPELKWQLVRAAIAGMDAILAVDPRARFVHCDPLVYVVAPRDAPHLEGEANYFNYHFVHEAWDMLGGIKAPELGGSSRHLDIIGVNYYGHNQWEHQRPDNILAPGDPRRLPFSELLGRLHARYQKPILVSETSSHGDFRASWLREIGAECLRAVECGVELHGLCLYPILDMFDWQNTGNRLQMGLWELNLCAQDGERLERILHEPTFIELQSLQSSLARHQVIPSPEPLLAVS